MKKRLLNFFFAFLMSSFSFSQAFQDSLRASPNPFVKHTNIFFSFSSHDTVSIKIYQNIGQLVNIFNLFSDSIMSPGAYSDSLFMDSYADGTYFVELQLGHRKTIMKSIVKGSVAGIGQQALNTFDFRCYPNPANNILFLESGNPDLSNATIVLESSDGRILLSQSFRTEVNISHFPPGIYEVRLTGGSNVSRFRFIKL